MPKVGGSNKKNFRKFPHKKRQFNQHQHNRNPGRPNFHSFPKEYRHQDQLQERDVGITKFINEGEGFSGIIKARFSDFQVNEIDLNGELAKLTNTTIPKDFEETNGNEEEETDLTQSPIPQIPQSTWDEIRKMMEAAEPVPVTFNVTDISKEDRGKIHESIRKVFGKKMYANTVNKDGVKEMQFCKHTGDSRKTDNRVKWPDHLGEYVHFLVFKECMDTLEATMKIAHSVGIAASNFAYAGVKDKRAKTTQWFSVKKVEPWKLIIKTKAVRKLRIGNITFKDHPLKLGQLNGNKFRVALRNVEGSDELINSCLESLKAKGFINYYGLQRFGNDREVPTFSIGLQLLRGNWKEACNIILKPVKSDDPNVDISKAKKVYHETGSVAEALGQFEESKNKCIEYFLLLGLSKGHSNDYVNALERVPRNTRLLYLHSFQSLIWNNMASKRIEVFGMEAVEGDLVLVKECGDMDHLTKGEDDEEPDADGSGKHIDKTKVVKALTADDCKNYTIYDIVLPLPGFDIVYPKNMEPFYKELLESHGLNIDMPKQSVKSYNLSGTYRKVMGQVTDLSWKVMHYDDPNHNLIRSDLEEIYGNPEPESIPGGKYKALVLEFYLKSSSYATMVLRELLKTDTSSSAHAKLNNYFEEKPKMVVPKTVTSGPSDTNGSLLDDLEKFKEFEDLVFNSDTESTPEPSLKRKSEETGEGSEENGVKAKVAKTCDISGTG